MTFAIYVVAPLLSFVLASVVVAFLIFRRTNRIGLAAMAGGAVIPAIWSIYGIISFDNMAPEDPAPGNLLIGFFIGAPIAFAISSLFCLLMLRIFASEGK